MAGPSGSVPGKSPFTVDISHLHDAFFETDDADEEKTLFKIINSKFGYAVEFLKPYALNSLGKVVQYYDDEMESRELQLEKMRRHTIPTEMPPPYIPKPRNKLVDLSPVKVEAEEAGEVEVVETKRVVKRKRIVVKGKGKWKGKGRAEETVWVPSTIILKLAIGENVVVKLVKQDKGKGEMVEADDKGKRRGRTRRGVESEVERLTLGGNDRRLTRGVRKPIEEPKICENYPLGTKVHDMFVEDEEDGWKWFKVVEEYDSGLFEGPELLTSPCLPQVVMNLTLIKTSSSL